jgi:hypothetical protein
MKKLSPDERRSASPVVYAIGGAFLTLLCFVLTFSFSQMHPDASMALMGVGGFALLVFVIVVVIGLGSARGGE